MSDDERPVILPDELRGRLPAEVILSLIRAVDAYRDGKPVVVRSTEENLLHGEETLKVIVSTGVPLEAFVVRNVPQDLCEETEWPEALEAARWVWLEDKWPKSSAGQENKESEL